MGTKPNTKQRKLQLSDHKDHKQSLGDIKGSQIIFSQYKDPKNRYEMIAQVCVKTKCFGKETIKKTLGKSF